jgi:hypothetical protein
MSVGKNLPFLEILTDVGFPLLKHIFGVSSSFRGLWAELTRNRLVNRDRNVKILTEVNISVVLHVVE